MALGARVKLARERLKMSQGKLGAKVGITASGIGALETRDSSQSAKAAELAKALNVSLEWLISGEGPMERSEIREVPTHYSAHQKAVLHHAYGNDEAEFIGMMQPWDSNTDLDDDEVELPLFREVEMAAGSGRTQVIENHGAKLRFAKSTLASAGVDPANAACARVKGNSMERLIPDGTTVGVDTGSKDIRDGEIYVFDHDGMMRVKYLYRRPGGALKIVSENSDEHPDEICSAEEVAENIRIIGRVFWWSVLR